VRARSKQTGRSDPFPAVCSIKWKWICRVRQPAFLYLITYLTVLPSLSLPDNHPSSNATAPMRAPPFMIQHTVRPPSPQ